MALHPLTWLVATVALAAAWWTLAWLAHDSPRPYLAWVARVAAAPPAWQAAAGVTYLAGIPLLALALRVVPPSRMGLVAPRSTAAAILAAAAVASSVAVLLFARRRFLRAVQRPEQPAWRLPPLQSVGWLVLGALCLELHWAFFRAGMLTLAFVTVEQAVMLAVGLLAIESWSDPWRRAALSDPDQAQDLAAGAVLALASASTFLLTGSSVWALVLHILARLIMEAATAQPGSAPAEATPALEVEPTVI